MCRALCLALLVALAGGCQLPPEQVPLKPLPEDGLPQAYSDLLSRARIEAAAANDAFYVNNWVSLEDAASGIEKVARYLAKATAIPPRHRDTLAVEAGDLGKEADKLREAARARDVKAANEILQRINLKVRELRADG